MAQPNSTVRLLSGVRLTPEYKDTIFFPNRSAQTDYFIGKTVQSFESISYQRKEKNTIRLQGVADYYYSVNYMMFRNTNYSNRWFYAFVTSVRYINENVFEIDYEEDVIQTWLLDCTLLPSFIERTHTPTDVIGEHLVTEPVSVGELKCSTMSRSGLFDTYKIVCAYAPQSSE